MTLLPGHGLLVVGFLGLLPDAAFAYIDPGSGAYLIQLAIVVVGAGLFYLSNPVKWIKAFFRKLFRRDSQQ